MNKIATIKTNRDIKTWLTRCLLALACSTTGLAYAEVKNGDGGAAIKKAQGMIRQLSQEKSDLEAEKASWQTEKTQLIATIQQLEAAAKVVPVLQAENERNKTNLESLKTALEAQLGQERQSRQQLMQKHNETVAKANDIYADNKLLVSAVKERETWINQCSEQNQQLSALNRDVIKQYKDKSLWQQMVELEPLTGIAAVAKDTLAENYRYRLQQLRITPYQASKATAPLDKDSTAFDASGLEVVAQPTAQPEAKHGD